MIIGAGPAGCSCAISLLNTDKYQVYLLDNSKSGKFHIGESIPPDMNLVMKQLGIYESFLEEGHEACYGSCSYWGSDKRGYNDSMLSPYGHGWHLDRARFNEYLVKECQKRGAHVLSNTSLVKSEELAEGHKVYFKTKGEETQSITVDFVVDASGGRGVFASAKGSLKNHGTPLVCIGIRFKNKARQPVTKLTYLESVEHGWWYAASIPGEYMLVTFYSTSEVVKQLGLHDLKNWFELLAASPNTFELVAQMEPVEPKVRGFKAESFCRDKIVGNNWLAIGDAATTYDPITSQGIIKAFTHGARAAELIEYHRRGEQAALPQFENEIKAQYSQYLQSRTYFYQLEKRWPDSPFWKTLQLTDELEHAS